MSADVTSAAAEFARRQQSPLQRLQHQLHGKPWISPLFLLLVAFLVFFIATPTFLTANSMGILLQQTAVVAALAVGQTLVILTAGIDLSVGAIMVLSMMVMATLARHDGMPGILALLIGVEVIGKVPATLHTPLMSGANSIHGIVIVGVVIVAAHATSPLAWVFIFLAAVLGTMNVVGGYVVTDRMLEMFKSDKSKKKGEDK